jgi:formamidopyrimidine-DNA glycosylase
LGFATLPTSGRHHREANPARQSHRARRGRLVCSGNPREEKAVPELPEVETVARQLASCVIGREVRRVRVLDTRLRTAPTPRLAGRSVAQVGRSGKRVLIEFSPGSGASGPLWLAVHLRMTGRLLWVPEGSAPPGGHLRACFDLDGGRLLFADARRFGTFTWYRDRLEASPSGVDPLAGELTPQRFAALLGDSAQNLKAWLLRQDRLVGIGNIYASEILHRARLSPLRRAGSLGAADRRALRGAAQSVLRRAIRNCGTTFSDFQDARGVEGSFQHFLAVYDREGRPCRRCGARVERVVQQQRSTFFCPGCQV